MKNMLFLAVAVFGISLTSCSQFIPAKKVDSANTNVNANASAFEMDVLAEINKYRASKKLSPLSMNKAVLDEARKHSADMASKAVAFGHDGFSQRSQRLSQKLSYIRNVGENVAYGQVSAKEVVEDWLTSPGHKKNIEGNFTETGIGIARNSKGVIYYTQIFIR